MYKWLLWLHETTCRIKRMSIEGTWITMGYELEARGSISGSEKIFLSYVQIDCGIHQTSYPMGTGGSFPLGYSGWGVKLTSRLHLVPRWRFTSTPSHVFIA
jgi:hypothetical protein